MIAVHFAVRTWAALGACALVALSACSRRESERPQDAARDSVSVLVGAGDIADCQSDEAERTARILDTVRGTVFAAGDEGYVSRRAPHPIESCYGPTWGRHLARTHAAPGNHEYEVDSVPREYFAYFGERGGASSNGYHAFDVGRWRVIALNSNVASDPGSPQGKWLAAELDADSGRCALAFMHHPRFSSGPHSQRERDKLIPLWRTLASRGVSVVVTGHDHIYERFAALNAEEQPDSIGGTREFVVGTGGAPEYVIRAAQPHSEVRDATAFGVIRFSLLPDRYRWTFIPVVPGTFSDSGSASCHPVHAQH